MSEGGDGLASAVAAAVEEAGPLLFADPEQVEMALGDGPRDRVTVQRAIAEVRRSAGRPKGSPNKRTAKIRDYLLSRYTHPLEVLAATAAQPDEHLAAELGCTLMEARTMRVRAAGELAPFMEGKMPVRVQFEGEGHLTLVLGAAPAAPAASVGTFGGGEAGAALISFAATESVENQGFGDVAGGVSE